MSEKLIQPSWIRSSLTRDVGTVRFARVQHILSPQVGRHRPLLATQVRVGRDVLSARPGNGPTAERMEALLGASEVEVREKGCVLRRLGPNHALGDEDEMDMRELGNLQKLIEIEERNPALSRLRVFNPKRHTTSPSTSVQRHCSEASHQHAS